MTGVLERVASRLAKRYLASYTQRLSSVGVMPLSPKQIHDTVWGTVTLTPLEVAVIDSPLVQRLRHLRQLGVAHWVYPSAAHSRFEHTLGVIHQVGQLVGAINRSSMSLYGAEIICKDDIDVLRMAAVLHDIGHPVLSHVSEYALELDAATLLELQRAKRKETEDVKLSEHIAASLVRTSEFKQLLTVVLQQHADKHLASGHWASRIDELTDRVSSCILGHPISDEVPLLHQLISGPFDADKLDYMVRDATMAGIPTIIDISRLLQKITVKKVIPKDLPKQISSRIPNTVSATYLFGFNWSGLTIVDELLLARMILYSKLYRHTKVAGVESMVQAIIKQLAMLASIENVINFIYDIVDDELILADKMTLLRRLETHSGRRTAAQENALTVSIDILRRLRERDLFVRAFAFSADESESDDQSPATLTKLAKRLNSRDKIEEFRSAVVAEAKNILATAHPEVLEKFDGKHIDDLIVVRKVSPSSQEELRRAIVFPSGGKPTTFGETGVHKDAWSGSFISASPKGYIFCPRTISSAVYIAAEVVIAREFDFVVPEETMEHAKQSPEAILTLKHALREKGYFIGKPRGVRPRAKRVLMSDVEPTIDDFVDRFAVVQESVREYVESEGVLGAATSMRQRAYDWVDQFDDPHHIECALDLLRRAKLVGRNEVFGAVQTFLGKYPSYGSAIVVPLSKGNESSQIVQYYAADVGADFTFCPSLADAAKLDTDAPVLFMDDFCASGGQLTNKLAGWFGDPALQRPDLNEQTSLALEPEREFLRSRRNGFVFMAGWNDGVSEIQRVTRELGVDADIYAHLTDDKIPTAFNGVGPESDSEAWARFETRCREIGTELLRTEGWPDEKVAQRALGYGNRALLLFFPYNSPAQTLTCMWKEGPVGGDSWQPLIRRRKKA